MTLAAVVLTFERFALMSAAGDASVRHRLLILFAFELSTSP